MEYSTKPVNFGQDLTNGTQNQPNLAPNQTSTDQNEPQTKLTLPEFGLVEFGLVFAYVMITVSSIAPVHMYKREISAISVN